VTQQRSRAVLSIWNDIDAEIEADYEDWYQRDHIRDRAGTPGFRSARRYQRISGAGREYFTFSDLEGIEVIGSPAYRNRLKEATEWTRRIMPHFRRLIRVAADVTIERGDGTGGIAGTAVYDPMDDAPRLAARREIEAALPAVMDDARITRVRILEANPLVNELPNPEAKLRPDPPRTAGIAIIIEGTSETAVARHLAALQVLPAVAPLTAAMPASLYRLLFTSQS